MSFAARNWICGEYWVIDLDSNHTDYQIIALIVINAILSVTSAILNISSILTIRRLKTLNHGTRLVLLNLCTTDFLTGIVAQPFYIIFLSLQWEGKQVCPLAKSVVTVGLALWMASFIMLIVASTERFLNVLHPFSYERMINSSKPRFVLGTVWCFAAISAALYNIPALKTSLVIASAGLNCIGCIWMSFVYARIFYLVIKHKNRIQAVENRFQDDAGRSKDRNSSTNLTVLIVVTSLLCYFPYSIALYYDFFSGSQTPQILVNWLWTLILANSSLNPVLYCVKNSEIRRALLKFWKVPYS